MPPYANGLYPIRDNKKICLDGTDGPFHIVYGDNGAGYPMYGIESVAKGMKEIFCLHRRSVNEMVNAWKPNNPPHHWPYINERSLLYDLFYCSSVNDSPIMETSGYLRLLTSYTSDQLDNIFTVKCRNDMKSIVQRYYNIINNGSSVEIIEAVIVLLWLSARYNYNNDNMDFPIAVVRQTSSMAYRMYDNSIDYTSGATKDSWEERIVFGFSVVTDIMTARNRWIKEKVETVYKGEGNLPDFDVEDDSEVNSPNYCPDSPEY
jgi:hypothetical protein